MHYKPMLSEEYCAHLSLPQLKSGDFPSSVPHWSSFAGKRSGIAKLKWSNVHYVLTLPSRMLSRCNIQSEKEYVFRTSSQTSEQSVCCF